MSGKKLSQLKLLDLKPFAVSAALLALGLPIVIGSELMARRLSLHPALIAVSLFGLYNFLLARFLDLNTDLRLYWHPKKFRTILWGCLIGAVLVMAPLFMATMVGATVPSGNGVSLSLRSMAATLAIIAWEELWFRGMALNYLAKNSSPLLASLFSSLLFVLMHALNPAMNLWTAAPNLFLASLLMASGYFYFRSIYFSVGLHYSWNMFHDWAGPLVLGKNISAGWFWGENGLFIAILLAFGATIFITLRRQGPCRRDFGVESSNPVVP